jgi:hypothetical protein
MYETAKRKVVMHRYVGFDHYIFVGLRRILIRFSDDDTTTRGQRRSPKRGRSGIRSASGGL